MPAFAPAETTQPALADNPEVNGTDRFDVLDDIADKNADVKVGKYVTPDESAFTFEKVEQGVALTRYTGTETAVAIPAQLGGKDVVEIRAM